MKIRTLERKRPEDWQYMFFCPGCKCGHAFKTDGPRPTWTFNGDMDKPTITPSLLVTSGDKNGDTVCHSFITNGDMIFLGDCTHDLAGKTVPLEYF